MSDFENPYKSPETSIVPEKTQGAGAALTETMLGYLKEASPWLRFIGIIGFIGSGITCLGGVIFAVTSSVVTSAFSGIAEELGVFAAFPVGLLSLFYIGAGVLLFFPAYFTYNFGAKIRSYQLSSSDEDLELAFKNNKSLWKFNGIILIIYLAFIPVSIILMIIIGIVAAIGLIN